MCLFKCVVDEGRWLAVDLRNQQEQPYLSHPVWQCTWLDQTFHLPAMHPQGEWDIPTLPTPPTGPNTLTILQYPLLALIRLCYINTQQLLFIPSGIQVSQHQLFVDLIVIMFCG